MNKCIVRKLAATVKNENLNVLGQIVTAITVPSSKLYWYRASLPNTTKITITDDDCTITEVTGNAVLIDSKSAYLGSTGNGITFSRSGLVHLKVDNKYYVCQFAESASGIARNLAELEYMTEIDTFNVSSASYGDLSSLSKLTKVAYFNCNAPKVTGDLSAIKDWNSLYDFNSVNTLISGDIVNFGKCTRITGIKMSTNITGTIESLVIAQVKNGRTTNSDGISFGTNAGKVTFDGEPISESTEVIVTWKPGVSTGYTDVTLHGKTISVYTA